MYGRGGLRGWCSVDGCDLPHYGHGFCNKHWQRWKAYGRVELSEWGRVRELSLEERFWAKVDKGGPGGCWLWTASLNRQGYGLFHRPDGGGGAYRFAYEQMVGPVPDGLQLDHLCRVRSCVNPAHLEPVTARENTMRGNTISAANAAKTHCVHGHPFDDANTRWYRGRRYCNACRILRNARRSVA